MKILICFFLSLQTPARSQTQQIVHQSSYKECPAHQEFNMYKGYLKNLLPVNTTDEKLSELSVQLIANCKSNFISFKKITENLRQWNLPQAMILTISLDIFSKNPSDTGPLLEATRSTPSKSARGLPTLEFSALLKYLANHKSLTPLTKYQIFFDEAGSLHRDCQDTLDKKSRSSCAQLTLDMMQRYHWYQNGGLFDAIRKLKDQFISLPGASAYSPREVYGNCFNIVLMGPAAVQSYSKSLEEIRANRKEPLAAKVLEHDLNIALKLAQKSYGLNVN